WIESKSPSVGGRKIRRGVTIGMKWRIERLRWNCSRVVKAKMGTACTHCSVPRTSGDPYLSLTCPVTPRRGCFVGRSERIVGNPYLIGLGKSKTLSVNFAGRRNHGTLPTIV